MKKFDGKSFAAGLIMGTIGITTVFAATGITSASLNNTKITLNGAPLPLSKPLISVTMDNEQNASLYVPAHELFVNLGYIVNYDHEKNTMDLLPYSNNVHETVDDTVSDENMVIHISSNANQKNIAESGSFQAKDNQTLTLTITSDIQGGTADLFLFDPNGKEQRITIGSENVTKEIVLESGKWQYNCSGLFKDGGKVTIIGTIK